MKTAIIAFIACAAAAAATAAAPSRTPEAAWSHALEAGRTKIVAQAPKFVAVRMTIDRASYYSAVITEPELGINVDVSRSGLDSFWINGYLKGNAHPFDRRTTLAGTSIMGGGVNVDMRPFGSQMFLLSGVYKDAEGKDGSMNLHFDVHGLPVRDMSVHAKGDRKSVV